MEFRNWSVCKRKFYRGETFIMRIIDKIKADGVHISFEVFPPKTDAGFESVLKATDGIAELTPSFISVTYGAGGGTSKNTVKIASHIKNDLKIPALAHLTCVSSTKEEVHKVIGQLQKEGILEEKIIAIDEMFPTYAQVVLPPKTAAAVRNGNSFRKRDISQETALKEYENDERVRVYDESHQFIAIYCYCRKDDLFKIVKMFFDGNEKK